MSSRKIPQIDSIDELARFWDTHDLTEFEGELVEVEEPLFERETVVRLPLPSEEVALLKRMADSQGLGLTDLIRQWVLERVHGS